MSRHWPKVRLGEVLRRSDEMAELHADTEYSEITVRLWGKGVIERGRLLGAEIAGNKRFVAREGQFIASRIDARNGAMGIVPAHLDGAVVTNDFPLFNIDAGRLLPAYFRWLSGTQGFVELCLLASEGTTNRVRLKEDRFLALEIPLPPLAEQHRIVARIEELAAQIHDARTLRHEASEAAEALLSATRRKIFNDCGAKAVSLENVCSEITDNLHSNPRYSESGVPCIRSPDVGYGSLNLDRALCTDETEYRRRTVRGEPQQDDIVFVREGGGTGKCALVGPDQRFSLGQRVMMLRPSQERIEPRFFLHQLLSPHVQEDQIRPLCKGSASPHLNISALRQFSIRLPSLNEQRRIVAELDTLQAEVDTLKRHQRDTAAELDALLPAILDRAFRGEL